MRSAASFSYNFLIFTPCDWLIGVWLWISLCNTARAFPCTRRYSGGRSRAAAEVVVVGSVTHKQKFHTRHVPYLYFFQLFAHINYFSGVTSDIIVFGDSDIYKNFSTFLAPHEDEKKFQPAPVNTLERPAFIFFSSGTTGLPKGIVINHYSMGAQAYNMM